MSDTTIPVDDFTELVDADLPRVDLVGKSANGHRVLIAKAEASTASMDERPDSDFAYVEPGGKKANGKTTPLSLRHFAIYDEAHTRNALSRAPQSPFGDKAMPKIKAAAKKFGIDVAKAQEETDMPDTDTVEQVAKDAVAESTSDGAEASEGGASEQVGSLSDHDADQPTAQAADNTGSADAGATNVAKADDEVSEDPGEVDLATPLAEGTADGIVGDENVPGSPAWESVDAATARKWTGVLGRTKNALEVLAQREMVEADTGGDADSIDNSFDLNDAACALDYAIGVLAAYAVDEELEAQTGTEEIQAVGKAAEGIDPGALDVLEQLVPIAKAGRVLSAANEGKIRDAVDSLSQVLSSLPAAPAVDDVAKEGDEPTTADTTEPVADTADDGHSSSASVGVSKEAAVIAEAVAAAVAKADEPEPEPDEVARADDPLAKVSDADLKRQALTGSGSEQKAALVELGLRVLMGTTGADADAPADAPDDTPAEPEDVGTPTDATAATEPAPPPATTASTSAEEPVAKTAQEVLKEMIEEQVTAVLKARDDEHAEVVKALEDRIADLEAPAPSKVLTRGAERVRGDEDRPMPEPHVLRGQNVGALRHETVAKEEWTSAPDATTRAARALELETAAAEALRQLHATRPPHRN
jgi:hypothetical protein